MPAFSKPEYEEKFFHCSECSHKFKLSFLKGTTCPICYAKNNAMIEKLLCKHKGVGDIEFAKVMCRSDNTYKCPIVGCSESLKCYCDICNKKISCSNKSKHMKNYHGLNSTAQAVPQVNHQQQQLPVQTYDDLSMQQTAPTPVCHIKPARSISPMALEATKVIAQDMQKASVDSLVALMKTKCTSLYDFIKSKEKPLPIDQKKHANGLVPPMNAFHEKPSVTAVHNEEALTTENADLSLSK